ncbi:autophagy protein Apg9-domain-containing protein [Blyttiomyces helicus]|uniref:Autophagy-related protein 9 n=1 Tax=Blyttiomyces helicus TaxID=388810 RepID=A0A4P9WP22_9FUNG|nr:autophagy protein Apg9-domain-containing protein [Blyttiomyces helicus]|eukprot:RKO92970.1 autophagy protein Apg9-domain-containing protein [Blyttiomyces helicus]
MCALVVYFIYRYVGEYHRNPKAMGSYAFSPLARWKVRNFNELPHDYVTRLNKIHPRIIEYLAQFSNESWNIISKFISFVLGATLLITLIVSFFNPELTLSLFLADKPLIIYAGIFGTIYVAIGNTEYVKSYKPDEKFTELISLLDPTPFYGTSPWETMNTSERYVGIRKLFNYRWLVFLQEILSVVYVPFILLLQLPDKSKDIVKFFRDNSHDDKDLGVVCTYGIFKENDHVVDNDLEGGNSDPVRNSAEEGTYSFINRKTTSSVINFQKSYPNWNSNHAIVTDQRPRQYGTTMHNLHNNVNTSKLEESGSRPQYRPNSQESAFTAESFQTAIDRPFSYDVTNRLENDLFMANNPPSENIPFKFLNLT